MIERGINVKKAESELTVLEGKAKSARVTESALGDWDVILQKPNEEIPTLLEARGYWLAKRSKFTDAAQAAKKLTEQRTAEGVHLYSAACVFSLCASSIKAADGSEFTAEQSALRQEWIKHAIAALQRSIAKGWTDFDHMQQDTDLTILRDLPEFKALIPSKLAKPDVLGVPQP